MSNIRSRKARKAPAFSGGAAVRDAVQGFIRRYRVNDALTYTRGLQIRANPTIGLTARGDAVKIFDA